MRKNCLNTGQQATNNKTVPRITVAYLANYIFNEMDFVFGTAFSKPSCIYFYPTWRCNCRCVMCISRPRVSAEMPLPIIKEFLLNARKWLGPFVLNFTGGEPLVRKDFWEIASYADSLGIKASMMTNGTLISEKDIQSIRKSGLKRLNISLDSLNPKVYKLIRGKPYDARLFKTIRLIRDCGIRVNINTIITRQNIKDIPKLVEFVQRERIGTISLNPLFLGWCSDVKKKLNNIWPNSRKVEAVIEKMEAYKKKGYPILNSVSHLRLIRRYYKNPELSYGRCVMPLTLRVEPSGDAFVCYERVGNVTKNSPEEIWNSDTAKKARKRLYRCKRSCAIASCCIRESLCVRLKRRIPDVHITHLGKKLKSVLIPD